MGEAFGALERAVGFYDVEGGEDDDVALARRELANARKLLEAAEIELERHNCVCRLNPLVGGPVPCQTCQMRTLITACRASARKNQNA